jgi:hypothetical protein
MKFLQLLVLAAGLLAPFTARAEYVVNQLTWVAKDKAGIGVVHADPSHPAVRRWTTNGTTYTCNTTFVLATEYRAIVHCPQIDYTLDMRRDKILVVANGGVAEYPGSWDDRRAWVYRDGDAQGSFAFQDGLTWLEQKVRGGAVVESHTFRETWRDDTFIYMFDASRTVHVALTRTKASMLLAGDAAYKPLYDGHW